LVVDSLSSSAGLASSFVFLASGSSPATGSSISRFSPDKGAVSSSVAVSSFAAFSDSASSTVSSVASVTFSSVVSVGFSSVTSVGVTSCTVIRS